MRFVLSHVSKTGRHGAPNSLFRICRLVGGTNVRAPARDVGAVVGVLRSEETAKGWLLVDDDEDVRDEQESAHEGEETPRREVEGCSGKGGRSSDVHRVADEAIRSTDHQ